MTAQTATRRRDVALVEGEYHFTKRDFDYIASFLRERTGIALTEAKAALVYSRLAKRLRQLGIGAFDDYCRFLVSDSGAGEQHEMINALTTNVTRFYREPHHFEHLRDEVLPRLEAAARQSRRIRLWSAACSSGEEPYSMALTILSAFPEAVRHDIKILATDIDARVLARARIGLYSDDAVAPIPGVIRERWMSRERDGGETRWRVKDAVRQLVTFNELNLIGRWPMHGQFDVIFCRNVVIYFEEDTQAALWKRFKDVMKPDARLYIGHSERIDAASFVGDGLTVYKLGGAA